jgi:hypothetical protein
MGQQWGGFSQALSLFVGEKSDLIKKRTESNDTKQANDSMVLFSKGGLRSRCGV